MLRGLPGAGKSTFAKKYCAEHPDTVRVNRDLIREMLHFGDWKPQWEAGVVAVECAVAEYFLSEQRQNVIVDDTNLSEKHEALWANFCEKLRHKGLVDLEFEIHDLKTDVMTCIERDAQREKTLGPSVIMQFAMSNGLMDQDIHYVLCDLDGTLCDLSHRRHYVREKPKNWKKFFEELPKDTLRKEVYSDVEDTLADARKDKRTYLILVSARPETYRKQTEEWLEKWGVDDYAALIMRRAGDSRDDTIVKNEILDRYFKDKSKIIKVFDDRPRVISMWRDNGLEVVDVGDGEEF